MSVVQQDLTASEQSMSKAIAEAWLSGVPEGTMIGVMPLPQKPDDLTEEQITDWLLSATVPLAYLRLHP
jgi:hypothetical protein